MILTGEVFKLQVLSTSQYRLNHWQTSSPYAIYLSSLLFGPNLSVSINKTSANVIIRQRKGDVSLRKVVERNSRITMMNRVITLIMSEKIKQLTYIRARTITSIVMFFNFRPIIKNWINPKKRNYPIHKKILYLPN